MSLAFKHATILSARERGQPPIKSMGSNHTPVPSSQHQQSSRRSIMTGLLAILPAASLSLEACAEDVPWTPSQLQSAPQAASNELTSITDRVFLDFGLCPEGVRSDRLLGDKSILCNEPAPMGRVVIGLYGNAARGTVAAFKTVAASGALNGSALSKIFPGRWITAGQQGPRRSGLLEPPPGLLELPPNPDILSASAFRLNHLRPGTVSLNLSENEDDNYLRMQAGYRPLSFLITTGPGPAPSLDGENIVFGTVMEGLDVIADIGTVPTFQPNDNLVAYNKFAQLLGDERAMKTRAKWGKPLKAVVITGSGILLN